GQFPWLLPTLIGGGYDIPWEPQWQATAYAFLLNRSGRPFSDPITVYVRLGYGGSRIDSSRVNPEEHSLPAALTVGATGADFSLLPLQERLNNGFEIRIQATMSDPLLLPVVGWRMRPEEERDQFHLAHLEDEPGEYSGLGVGEDEPLTAASSFLFFLLRKPPGDT
ncbi:MAG TPA: hypothetical protein VD962_02295, partial [Rubricoccaceae bacterium]|nr:hypothetical protein [Rubricoccaceae bacterium]